MPFHFCSDELFMLMSMLPFIGVAFRKAHTWYHAKVKHAEHIVDPVVRSVKSDNDSGLSETLAGPNGKGPERV